MLLVAVLGLILAQGSAQAERPYELSGSSLLAQCEEYLSSGGRGVESARCAEYVQGAVDAMSLFEELLKRSGGNADNIAMARVCIPSGTTYEHIRIIVKYLRDHPQHLHMNRYVVSHVAVSDAFPCKAK